MDNTKIFIITVAVLAGLFLGTQVSSKKQLGAIQPGSTSFTSVATSGAVVLGPAAAVGHGFDLLVGTTSNRAYASITNMSPNAIFLCFSSTSGCHPQVGGNLQGGIIVAASSTYEIGPLNAYAGPIRAFSKATTTKQILIQQAVY